MPKPLISLVHPTGNPNVRNVAIALAQANVLHEVITTLAFNPTGSLARCLKGLPSALGSPMLSELGRRHWPLPPAVVKSHPWQEVARLLLERSGLVRRLGLSSQGLTDWVYATLDRHVARNHLQGIQAIYAYEDGAAETFAVAKAQGIRCLYDLPIAFYRTSQAIQQDEAQRFPELAPALAAAHEPEWKLQRKHQEMQLADHIMVPSRFVLTSLVEEGIPPERISVIPFGAPIDYFQPRPKPDAIFRPLFVGRIGPRKGVHYLLQAWQSLNLPQAELLLIGVNECPPTWFHRHTNQVRHLPSLPHARLNDYYSTGSVLVLPSLVEGMPLVALEAMACGIPLIITPNAAGLDLITDGVEGFIIPIRDVDALKTRLEWCYQHPRELAAMGVAARRRAETFTWAGYRDRWWQTIQTIMAS